MKYDPYKHHRRSIRLKGYDYSQEGWYFVTICVQNREKLFGDVISEEMQLNMVGKIIDFHWKKLPHHFKNIELDKYQIMPNHLHGIIHIVGAMHSDKNNLKNMEKSFKNASPLREPQQINTYPHGTKPGSLGAIMQNFQSVTTRKINRIRKTPGVRLWQRNYWERVIRDEKELNKIRNYIIYNPINWENDKENI